MVVRTPKFKFWAGNPLMSHSDAQQNFQKILVRMHSIYEKGPILTIATFLVHRL